jgi:hypothetical protein
LLVVLVVVVADVVVLDEDIDRRVRVYTVVVDVRRVDGHAADDHIAAGNNRQKETHARRSIRVLYNQSVHSLSWQVFDFVKAVAAVRRQKTGVFAPAKCRVHHPAVWHADACDRIERSTPGALLYQYQRGREPILRNQNFDAETCVDCLVSAPKWRVNQRYAFNQHVPAAEELNEDRSEVVARPEHTRVCSSTERSRLSRYCAR